MKDDQEMVEKAKDFVLKLLSRYPRTIWEVKMKMQKKNFSPKIIQKTIDYFTEIGHLDDKKYIKIWLDQQLKNRPCGKMLCFQKLKARGIDSQLIREVLDKEINNEREIAIAVDLVLKKKQRFNNLPKRKRALKISQFLKNKGFSYNTILEVLHREKVDNIDI